MSKTIEYTEAIVPYRHEELMAKVAAQLTDKRYQQTVTLGMRGSEQNGFRGLQNKTGAHTLT